MQNKPPKKDVLIKAGIAAACIGLLMLVIAGTKKGAARKSNLPLDKRSTDYLSKKMTDCVKTEDYETAAVIKKIMDARVSKRA